MIDTMIGVIALVALIFGLMALVWIIVLAVLTLAVTFAHLFYFIVGDCNE